jgi:hypothetical protein
MEVTLTLCPGWGPKPSLNILEKRNRRNEGVRFLECGKTYFKYSRLRRYVEITDVFKIEGGGGGGSGMIVLEVLCCADVE